MTDDPTIDDAEDTGLPDNKPADQQAEDLVAKVKRLRKSADETQGKWRQEARQDFAFLAGNQWTVEEQAVMEDLKRIPVVFNRVEPTIESIAGHEVNNRQSVKYIPRGLGTDAPVSELLSNAADYVRDQCDAEDEESDAFVDMLTCGVGATDTGLEYDTNPDGDITIGRVDPLKARWDPAARKRNLVDRTWDQIDIEMTLREIRDEWPDKADEMTAQSLVPEDADDLDDGDPHDATAAPYYRNDQAPGEKRQGYRTVIRHQWYETKAYWRVLGMDGQVQDLDEKEYARVEQAAAVGMVPPPQRAVKLKKRVYYTAFICGGVLLEKRESITQKGFQLNFITGRRDRNRNSWYGVVRPMRDPQRFANTYLSMMHAMVRGGAKGGLIVEEGATDNPRKLEEDWAKQDSVITVNDGALSQGKVQPKPPVVFPPGPEKLLEFSVSSIRDVTGVNLEALGLADRNQPGIVELQRRESALTILAPLFNSLRRYRKVQGRVLADLIIRFISDGRLIRIVQGDGTEQFVPLVRLPETIEYDVVVDSSSNAPDQKNRTFAVMSQLIPALEKSGFPTPPEILDHVPLPQSLVTAWKGALQKKMQQPPQPPPEIMKAQIMANVDLQKAQMADALKRAQIDMDAKLEVYKTAVKAQSDAQAEQLRAAINEQSQIINAQANEQKAFAGMVEARIEGLARLIEAGAKARAAVQSQADKTNRVAQRSNDRIDDLHAEIVGKKSSWHEALQSTIDNLSRTLAAPRQPLRVIRDENGDIQGVQ